MSGKRNKSRYGKITELSRCSVNTAAPTASDATASGATASNSNKCVVPRAFNRVSNSDRKRVALDCEMVGVGRLGRRLIIARVSIVDEAGKVLMDSYVKPNQPVTNYKTEISGIRPSDLENAERYYKVRQRAINLLRGKILVGHALQHDLKLLNIEHPEDDIRDTALYHILKESIGNGQSPSLKLVTKILLNREIQTGEHNSIEDARSSMEIYKKLRDDWEKYLNSFYF